MGRKSWIAIGIVGVLAVGVGAGAYFLKDPIDYARIATGYAAQQTCACLHVSGRPLESCMRDFPPDAVSKFHIDTSGDSVRVSAMGGLFKAQADYDATYGCRLAR